MDLLHDAFHGVTGYRLAEDPPLHCEMSAVVDRVLQSSAELSRLLNTEASNATLQFMRACQSFVANPSSQNQKLMRASWAKLDFVEQREFKKVGLWQRNDELGARTLLRLIDTSAPLAPKDGPSGPLAPRRFEKIVRSVSARPC